MSSQVADSEWFADETFWKASYGNMFPERRFARDSARELTQMMIDAGFRSATCFGNFAGAAYGPEAPRLVVVARR